MSAYDEIRRRLTRREAAFEPCLPRAAKGPPVGPEWIHEIRHDGFRILVRRQGRRVRLVSRKAGDLTYRFPLISAAVSSLASDSWVIDGEAIVCNDNGLPVFDLIRNYRYGSSATLCAFDVLELNGQDLRDRALEERKAALKMLLRPSHPGSPTIATSTSMGRLSSTMLASSAAKGSCASALARCTARAAPATGSSSRTRRRRP
jgi:ATP-dependent DNA ligase